MACFLACQNSPEPNLSSEPAPSAEIPSESGFIHAVYFYLGDDMSEEQKKDFSLVLDSLAQIPPLKSVYYGPPAMTDRKVVDNSYDYAWVCFFEDAAGHDAYQEHPLHLDFIKRYSPLIKDVKIFDNLY